MKATWLFCAPPWPTTPCLTRRGAYSWMGNPRWAAANKAAPRAVPSTIAVFMLCTKMTDSNDAQSG